MESRSEEGAKEKLVWSGIEKFKVKNSLTGAEIEERVEGVGT